MTASEITVSQLAVLLENEAHNAMAERIRAGSAALDVLSDGKGGLTKALRSSRYEDAASRMAKDIFTQIVTGDMLVVEDAR